MAYLNQTGRMNEGNITKQLWQFFLPATTALALTASYSIVDAVFVGRLGSEALAALSVALPAQMIFGAVAMGSGVGAASLVDLALRAGKHEEARSTLGQVLLLGMLMGCILSLIGRLYLEPLLLFCGATPQILAPAAEYMSVFTSGAVFHLISYMMACTIRAEGNRALPVAVMVISAAVNLILDPLFIFVLNHGIKGAALSTELSKAINVICYLWYYLSGKGPLTISLNHLRPCLKIIRSIFRNGLPTIALQASSHISLIFANKCLGEFGYAALAVMGIIVQLQHLAIMPVMGLNQGLLPMISHSFSVKNFSQVGKLLAKGSRAAIFISVLAGLSFFFFPEPFMHLFTREELILTEGPRALRIMAVIYPVISLPLLNISFFQGIGKTVYALILSFAHQFLFYIPLVFFMKEPFGLTGVWAATPLAALFAAAAGTCLLTREMKLHRIPFSSRD